MNGKLLISTLNLRGHPVLIDADLAKLYGVQTKRLNEQLKRNAERFPVDFVFQLTAKEKSEVVANCDHLKNLKFSKTLPYAFTEHGALMASNVLQRGSGKNECVHHPKHSGSRYRCAAHDRADS